MAFPLYPDDVYFRKCYEYIIQEHVWYFCIIPLKTTLTVKQISFYIFEYYCLQSTYLLTYFNLLNLSTSLLKSHFVLERGYIFAKLLKLLIQST